MRQLIFLVLFFGLSSGYAQDNDVIEYDEILAEMQKASDDQATPQFSFAASSSEFNNTAYSLTGQMWNIAPTFTRKDLWMLGFDIPFLQGKAGTRAAQEIGNIRFRSRFNAWDISQGYSLWVPFSVRLAQRGEAFALASQHDTYRSGLDLDYRRGMFLNSIGIAYQYRTLENDPRFDVGDIIDFHNAIRLNLTNSVSARLVFEFYRISPTTYRKTNLVPTIDWASVSPGIGVDLFGGIYTTAEVVVPVIQSGTPFQTDLAFGEVYYPQASTVTLNWGLGANF